MDLQFWIYVAVVVFSIWAQIRKKKAPQSDQDPAPPYRGDDPPPKPISFEDLLREIQQTRAPQNQPPPVLQVPYNEYDEVDDDEPDRRPEEQSLEKTQPVFANSFEIYEKAKAEAFVRPSLEETLKVEDTDMRFGQFDKYQHVQEVVPAKSFAETFRNFDEFKRAFVMAEILQRKY